MKKTDENNEIISFGEYNEMPLSWVQLKCCENSMLLLCYHIISYLPFHDKYEPIVWGQCTLRKWLNNGFLNIAFTDPEQERMVKTLNQTKNGEDTFDKVWLLSAAEAKEYLAEDNVALSGPADYLTPRHIGQYIGVRRRDVWLLRSNANFENNLCEVSNVIDCSGYSTTHQINEDGRNLNVNCIAGIRPVIIVKK